MNSEQKAWWRQLDVNFNKTKVEAGLLGGDNIKVSLAAGLDTLFRTLLSSGLTAMMGKKLLKDFEREIESLGFYTKALEQGEKSSVFNEPSAEVIDSICCDFKVKRNGRYGPINVYNLSFESDYSPLNPAMNCYLDHVENLRAEAEYWCHETAAPRKTLVFSHGFLFSHYGLNAAIFCLEYFYRHGYDIVLYKLPFHGPRRLKSNLVSGVGIFSMGWMHANESLLHGLYDLRVLVKYLKVNRAPTVGLSGFSLGGYISSLAACVEPELAFVVPNAGVVSPVDTLLEWWPLSTIFERLAKPSNISIDVFRHGLAIHSPLTWQPLLPPERLFLIGGAGDRLVHPRYIYLLQQHWQGCNIYWDSSSHAIFFKRKEYQRALLNFMESCQ